MKPLLGALSATVVKECLDRRTYAPPARPHRGALEVRVGDVVKALETPHPGTEGAPAPGPGDELLLEGGVLSRVWGRRSLAGLQQVANHPPAQALEVFTRAHVEQVAAAADEQPYPLQVDGVGAAVDQPFTHQGHGGGHFGGVLARHADGVGPDADGPGVGAEGATVDRPLVAGEAARGHQNPMHEVLRSLAVTTPAGR